MRRRRYKDGAAACCAGGGRGYWDFWSHWPFELAKLCRVNDLASYYQSLAEWEGKPAVELVSAWSSSDVEEIARDFRAAFASKGFEGSPLTVGAATSNQSIGNKVAEFLVEEMNQYLQRFRIEACSGAGYPDKRLLRRTGGASFAFELKATSEFDPNDSNRIVLTSSSEKLRRYFRPPVLHLLATACYGQDGEEVKIQNLRLDFLEPSTPVNVRLEASVSQRLLARGTHRNFCF